MMIAMTKKLKLKTAKDQEYFFKLKTAKDQEYFFKIETTKDQDPI